MREFLKGLDLDQETVDTIMAEYGKNVQGLKEKIDDYKKQVDDYEKQVSELNKTVEEDKKSLEDLQGVTNENNDLKAQIQLSGANVKKEFMKFVTSEVRGKVDDKTDFDTALKNYKKENPQYFGDTVVKKVQTSPTLSGGNPEPQSTNNIMNDLIRGSV